MQLRNDIRSVQSQLKSAIQNHQMIVFKLKDRPVSIKLRVQMSHVQRHIVSLGERQKILLQQLRKELEASGGGTTQSLKPIQNLRPNPLNPLVQPLNVKQEPCENKSESDENAGMKPVKPAVVSHSSRRKSKLVATPDLPLRNGHVLTPSSSPSQKENTPSSTPSSSPPHSVNTVRQPKQRTPKRENAVPSSASVSASASDESQDASIHLPADPELRKKLQFMTALSLVTREVLTELQNRRTERKRRSTANPQFLYGNNIDQAMKRKKMIYLASSSSGSVVPTNIPSDSKEQTKPVQNMACLSCFSSDGTLNVCSMCQKAFHWSCSFDASSSIPSEEALMCRACQDSAKSSEVITSTSG